MSFLGTDFFNRLYRGRSFERNSDEAATRNLTHRICPRDRYVSGFEDVYAADGKLLVTVRNLRARRTFHDRSSGLGRLVIVFHMSGRRDIQLGSGPPITIEGSRLGAYFLANGQSMQSTWAAGSHESSVIIGSWPEYLEAIIGERFAVLRQLIDADGQPCMLNMPMPARTRSAVEDIVNPRVSQDLMPRFLEAKAQEAFCLAVDALTLEYGAPGQVADAQYNAVVGILARIDRALQEPLDPGYLARSIGLSKRDFSRLFREVTGKTYPEYISKTRIERSRHLIETTDLPLKQIAHAVGYRHASNLSLSISLAFGMSPKNLRMQALKKTHELAAATEQDLS